MKNLAENSEVLGQLFRFELNNYIPNNPLVKLVRGKGLLKCYCDKRF